MQTRKYIVFCSFGLLYLCTTMIGFSQTDSISGTHVDEDGKYYQRADLPVYLHISTSPNGSSVPLPGQKSAQKELSVKPIMLDGHGRHLIKHYDGKNSKHNYQYVIYADGLPPTSSSTFQAPHVYKKDGLVYYGKNLEVLLETKDQMSGVRDFYYNLDSAGDKLYQDKIPVASEGKHSLQYFATDKVGNTEETKTKEFIVDVTPPKTVSHVVGINKNIISLSSKLYLTLSDNNVGVHKTYYRFDEQEWKSYSNKRNISIASLSDGNHTLSFYSMDFLKNQEVEQRFSFYLDRTAPIMSADVLGDKFIIAQQVYFSGRTKLKLTAVDNKSGVKEVWYSVDGGDFQLYKEPFYLPSKSGKHTVRYYAVDNIENQGVEGSIDPRFDTYRHIVNAVYVDLTGPKLSYNYKGSTFQKGNTLYISPETQLNFGAVDKESGLQKITYKLGNEEEALYEKPFTVKKSGKQELQIIGYDNVNNRNVVNTQFLVDTEPPTIFYHFSTMPDQDGDANAYPSYVQLFLGAQDPQTNTEKIYYRINGGAEKLYTGKISGFEKNSKYTISVEVKDKLGNLATEEIIFQTLDY